jgi:hypothetical protein
MNKRTVRFRFEFSRFTFSAALLIGASLSSAQTPAGWKTVSPGFTAQALLSHNNAMWAAGSGESIAASTDAGQHWVRKHENSSGALLLSFAFVTGKFGYAAGTGGTVIFTKDGGESWTAQRLAQESILQAAFADTEHGVIRTRSALLATTDGGKSWNPVVPANDPDWSAKYPFTENMAALDSTHLLVRVSEGKLSDGEFLWTADGGATWSANYLSNGAGRDNLFVAQGRYWTVGHEIVNKDKPGGGGSEPMAVTSKDGIDWEHRPVYYDVCHWHDCGGCTPQGCFAGQSSFVPFSRILQDAPGNTPASASVQNAIEQEKLGRFPAHLLTNQWALTGQTLCLLTQGVIDCTTLEPAASLDTKDESFDFDQSSWPPLHPTPGGALNLSIEPALGHGIRCIRCNLLRTYFSETGNSGPTPFEISFVVGTSGIAENFKLKGSLPDDVAARVRNAASSWIFEPPLENGKAKPVHETLSGTIFVMNFAKPPR